MAQFLTLLIAFSAAKSSIYLHQQRPKYIPCNSYKSIGWTGIPNEGNEGDIKSYYSGTNL